MSMSPARSPARRSSRGTAVRTSRSRRAGSPHHASLRTREGARVGVDALDAERPGRDGEFGACPVVEPVGVGGDRPRVQRAEQGFPVGVRLGERHLDLAGARSPRHVLDAVVAGVAGGPVRLVLAAERLPLGDEVGRGERLAVAPHRIRVQREHDRLPRLARGDLGGPQIVGVQLGSAVGVDGEQHGQDGARDPVGDAVRVELVGVQGLGQPVDGPGRPAAFGQLCAPGGGDRLGGARRPAVAVLGAGAAGDGEQRHEEGRAHRECRETAGATGGARDR